MGGIEIPQCGGLLPWCHDHCVGGCCTSRSGRTVRCDGGREWRRV